jgi:hypothetical protein
MKSFCRGFAVLLAIGVAAPALAQQGAVAPDDAVVVEPEDEEASWLRRLDEGAARLADAQRRVADLEGAKGRGAARRYPRGEAKEKYIEQLEAARAELAEAEEALPELVEDARRAGVPPGVLDRYENPADYAGEDS